MKGVETREVAVAQTAGCGVHERAARGTITVVETDNGWNRTIVQRAESMQKSMHMHKILPIF